MIRVRFAEVADQARLIAFIRDHWSPSHIFVDRPDVFVWQHLDSDGRLNMVLAEEDGERPTVLGVLGFIPMGRFDPTLGDRDIALAIWKVRDTGVPPGLGLRLLKHLQATLTPRMVAAIGISTIVRPIYQVLRYEVGALHQAALFHPDRTRPLRIADGVPEAAFAPVAATEAASITLEVLDETASSEVRAAVDAAGAATIPAKSWQYVAERFLAHPWYRYEARAVRRGGEVVAVVVWRAVEAAGARILRIVDIVGSADWLADAGPPLRAEVVAADAEYIDIMHWGVDEALLTTAGFVSLDDHPAMVLPNYFSPFEPRNVTIEIAVKAAADDVPVRLFRADSDQDRPNIAADLGSPP